MDHSKPQKFDIVVIGAGPGGYPAAITAAQGGASVALIENDQLGGTCLNRGCIPSKALIASAEVYLTLKDAAKWGVKATDVGFNYPEMVRRKENVVLKMRSGLENLIKANKITLFKGMATFQSPHEIKVKGSDQAILYAEKVIIATGSEPRIVPAFPCDGKRIHDSTSILNLQQLPKSLVIIGGGVIGCEFASLFNALGVEVTIIEMLPRILNTESQNMADALLKMFEKRHINVKVGQAVEKITDEVEISLKSGETLKAEMVLVAVGRAINSDRLDLSKAAIALEANGAIAVNKQMETSTRGIYAIGDVTGRFWLAHVSTHQGVIAAKNALGKKVSFHEEAIPSVVFTLPEVASVGLSPEKAKEKGYHTSVGRFPFLALGKAESAGHTEGFAEVVIDKATNQILGAQVIGHDASTLIAEMALAISCELTAEDIAETIHAHPTLSEVWHEAVLMALETPLHLPPKKKL